MLAQKIWKKMNSKIKELAEQAKQYARAQMNHSMNSNFFSAPVFEQKFAELIIEECAGIYDAIDNGNLVEGTDNYLEALSERFGVKE